MNADRRQTATTDRGCAVNHRELDHLCDALTSIVIQIDAAAVVRRWNRTA